MENECCVISRDFGDKISVRFNGSRYECKRWIKNMAKAGRMTHFYEVMSERKARKMIAGL